VDAGGHLTECHLLDYGRGGLLGMQREYVLYLDPASSHEQAAHELNLSRAAYFRRLKLASERVAEYLAQGASR
jgi:hypothetical protein